MFYIIETWEQNYSTWNSNVRWIDPDLFFSKEEAEKQATRRYGTCWYIIELTPFNAG